MRVCHGFTCYLWRCPASGTGVSLQCCNVASASYRDLTPQTVDPNARAGLGTLKVLLAMQSPGLIS
jgi:hypothetical protein